VIIAFVGPVGSGKSTYIHLLSKILQSRRQRVIVSCFKRSFISSLFVKILYFLIYGRKIIYRYPLESLLRGANLKLRNLITLWYVTDVFELSGRLLVLYILSKFIRITLLIEEYIPAILVDYLYISLRLKLRLRTILKYMNIMLYFYNKLHPLKVVFLSAPLKVLVKRWYQRGRAEHSQLYIHLQLHLLQQIVTFTTLSKNVVLIDSSNSKIIDTLRVILSSVYAEK